MRRHLAATLALGLLVAVGCGKSEKGGKSDKGGTSDESGASENKGGYAEKSKAVEAREFVKKMYDGARTYYMDPGMSAASIEAAVAEPQFPGPSVGPTPPLGACCKAGGKCTPDGSLWEEPTWVALFFSVDDPHYYSYEYKVDGKTFTASAYGDLDCDGVYSTYRMVGKVDEDSDGPAGDAELVVEKELE